MKANTRLAMVRQILSSPVRSASIAWTVLLPLSYVLGWVIGYVFGSDAILGSETGAVTGISVGGALSGLVTALLLRSSYPDLRSMKPKDVLIVAAGWAMALFVVARVELALMMD